MYKNDRRELPPLRDHVPAQVGLRPTISSQ